MAFLLAYIRLGQYAWAMQCPACNEAFPLTWRLFSKARLHCQFCDARLSVKFHWLDLPIGLLMSIVVIALANIGAVINYDVGGLVGFIIGMSLVIRFNKYWVGNHAKLTVTEKIDWRRRMKHATKALPYAVALLVVLGVIALWFFPFRWGTSYFFVVRPNNYPVLDGVTYFLSTPRPPDHLWYSSNATGPWRIHLWASGNRQTNQSLIVTSAKLTTTEGKVLELMTGGPEVVQFVSPKFPSFNGWSGSGDGMTRNTNTSPDIAEAKLFLGQSFRSRCKSGDSMRLDLNWRLVHSLGTNHYSTNLYFIAAGGRWSGFQYRYSDERTRTEMMKEDYQNYYGETPNE